MSPAVTYSRCQEENVRVLWVYDVTNDAALLHLLSLQWFAAQGPPEPAVFTLCSVVPCGFASQLFEVLRCPVAMSSTAELCSTCPILHLFITCLLHWVSIAPTGRNSERSYLLDVWCSWFCVSMSHFFSTIQALAWRNLSFSVQRNKQTKISRRRHSKHP